MQLQEENLFRRIKSEVVASASGLRPAFPEIFRGFYVFRSDFHFGGPRPPFSF